MLDAFTNDHIAHNIVANIKKKLVVPGIRALYSKGDTPDLYRHMAGASSSRTAIAERSCQQRE